MVLFFFNYGLKVTRKIERNGHVQETASDSDKPASIAESISSIAKRKYLSLHLVKSRRHSSKIKLIRSDVEMHVENHKKPLGKLSIKMPSKE